MAFVKQDSVLWPKHLSGQPEVLEALRRGAAEAPCTLLVEGAPVAFAPMNGADGFKAVGAGRERWTAVPYGNAVELDLPGGGTGGSPGHGGGPASAGGFRATAEAGRVAGDRAEGSALGHAGSGRGTAGRNAPPAPTGGLASRAAGWLPPVRRDAARPVAFDELLIVDWSASSPPKTGADSIWWTRAWWDGAELRIDRPVNEPTRARAGAAIRARLVDAVRADRSVLLGFDFPYAYPAGLAARLGLTGAPWLALWREVARRVRDRQGSNGTNDRFAVAAEFNRRLGGSAPFWGAPASAAGPHLGSTKPPQPWPVEEFRLVERRERGPKSAFQLYGAGSVGGQVLMGLPTLLRLREDPALAPVSTVWPFETGAALPPREPGRARIVHAEIYPSLVRFEAPGGWVKDEAQVAALAHDLARRDAAGELAACFEAPASLADAERRGVIEEEGWILGVP